MLLAILSTCSDDEIAESESDEDAAARGVNEPPTKPDRLGAKKAADKKQDYGCGEDATRVPNSPVRPLYVIPDLKLIPYHPAERKQRTLTELDSPTDGGFPAQRGPDALTVQGHNIGKSIRTFDDAYAFLFTHLPSLLTFPPSVAGPISRTSVFQTLTLSGRRYSLYPVCG